MDERPGCARVNFLVAWALALAAKAWLVIALPPFGDEAFYAQESTRLAWAYSDLPGLTAWLIRLGTTLFGDGIFGARVPFLALGAALPWLVVRIARRWFGVRVGWQAGWLATLLPLGGLMGVLALPDVPMLFAALLCVDAFARLMRRVGWVAVAQLAVGLALGAFAHYRFALVVVAGAAGVLCVPAGRVLLRSPRVWLAIVAGAAAWLPLLAWNVAHGGAGVEFQLLDRHPWQPQWLGFAWLPVQALVVTPLLFALLAATAWQAWRRRGDGPAWPFVAGVAAVAVGGYFLLAFFADSERVSFHWPLAGWLVLCTAAPVVLAGWPRWLRVAVPVTAALGLAATTAWLMLVADPAGRARLAASDLYADNFAGWDEVAAAVRARLASMPAGTGVVADNFMLGAQLSLALGRDDVLVLDHPLNRKHGRAEQLAQWGLLRDALSPGAGPRLLVVEDSARPMKARFAAYAELCRRSGGLPRPQVLNVDHGRKRFLLFALDAPRAGCSTPALAWIDAPLPGDAAAGRVTVRGWALKTGVGVSRVEVTLDGIVVAQARYGLPRADVIDYWTRAPVDAAGARVGFTADIDLSGHPPGTAWLGLVVHGADGSVEAWPGQPLDVTGQGSR